MVARESSRRLDVAALLGVGLAKLLLRRVRTPTVLRFLAGGGKAIVKRRTDPDLAAAAVARAARTLGAECLPQSVALTAVLQRTGAAPSLVIGCRRHSAGLWGAHAWVEVNGRRFDPLAHEEHEELCRLSAAGRWQIARPGATGSEDDADTDPVAD